LQFCDRFSHFCVDFLQHSGILWEIMAQLYITNAGQTTAHNLKGKIGAEFTIGSAESNSIPLPEAQDLSPTHCRIIKTENGFAIQDNQSDSGIYLGERKVDYELMLPRETYTMASVELVLVDDEVAPEAAAPRLVKRKVQPKAGAAPKKTLGAGKDIAALAEQYKRDQGLSGADIAYIVIVLIAAVYAGMALYSWQHDGNPLPIFFR